MSFLLGISNIYLLCVRRFLSTAPLPTASLPSGCHMPAMYQESDRIVSAVHSTLRIQEEKRVTEIRQTFRTVSIKSRSKLNTFPTSAIITTSSQLPRHPQTNTIYSSKIKYCCPLSKQAK